MKRVLSLLMTLALTLALLTGCGGGNTETKTNDQTQQPAASSSAAASSVAQEEKAEVRTEELWLQNGEKRIFGTMYLPAEEQETYPVVILSHGFGGSSIDNKLYAKTFAEAGYAAYAFDYCGGGRGSQSDGEMTEMSVLTEAEDLNAVIDQVKELDYVDASQLFLMGQSQGGFVSAYVAAQRPEDVAALVLYYPAFALQDGARERDPDPDNIPETEVVMNNTIGAIYTIDALSFDIYDVIGDYHDDVQILHGDLDDVVPISYSERAVDIYDAAELTVMKGSSHGFAGKVQREAAALTLDFLQAHTAQ